METRRVHRIKRARKRRALAGVALAGVALVGLLGIALGYALPRNATVAVLVLGVAAAALATAGYRMAPSAVSRRRGQRAQRSTTAAASAVLTQSRAESTPAGTRRHRRRVAHARRLIPAFVRDGANDARDGANFLDWAGLFGSPRDAHHGGAVRIHPRRAPSRPSLPARYEAIGAAVHFRSASSDGLALHRTTAHLQQPRTHRPSHVAKRAYVPLDTKYFWALVAVIYAYVALFALVVVLSILGH
jgi:hypothetical protein